MEFLQRKDIDTKKWDARIQADPTENIFCYSWYLDAVAKNWGAFVEGDYNTIVPVPFSTKLSVKSLYQPAFTREIDIFGHAIQWEELIIRYTKIFKAIHFRNRKNGIFPKYTERIHQFLDISSDYKYSTNAKRLIKKAHQHFTIELADNPEELITLFRETTFKKIDSINNEDLHRLENLMLSAIERDKGELFEVHQNGGMVAGGFFFKDKNRITYLKGASSMDAKKEGSMYGLINHAIERYKEDYKTFDFGGSTIDNVATFYKKFGAQDRIYFNYSIDNLPLWFKTLKRMKK